MKKPSYRLSPKEVEQLVKEERDRRRKLRIVQVREQAKASAAIIRNDVRKEKERLLNQFSSQVEAQLAAEKEEKVRKLRLKYEGTLRGIGDGHREAHVQGDGYSAAEQLQRQQEAELAAQGRFVSALKKQRLQDAAREHEQRKHLVARQAALEIERERATEIASLPPPAQDFCLEMDKKSRPAVRTTDMQTFASTHYHIPDYQVVRAGPQEQIDAKLDAENTDLKLKQDLMEKKRSLHEQKERARIRGNEALQKEMLKHDLGDMMQDLSLLQRQDRRRRQKVLAHVPNQVFIPPERCLEERQQRQSEMERKFDELYMGQFKEGGAAELQNIDISEYPTSQDSASDSIRESGETVDAIIPMSRINPALRDLTNVHPQAEEDGKSKEPDSVLKQLLGKIRAQREAPNSQVSVDPQLPARSGTMQDPEQVPPTDFASSDHPLAGNLSQCSQPRSSPEVKGHSDVDSETVTANDKMIEELIHRIKLIELQKQQLSHQFEAHAGALDSLLQPARPDSTGGRSLEASSDLTLKEVDIESMRVKDMELATGAGDVAGRLRKKESPGLDLASAVSNLRPVRGEKNLQYELLTSNGFLPSPELQQESSAGRDRVMTALERVEGGGDAVGTKLFDGSDGLSQNRHSGVDQSKEISRTDSGDGPRISVTVSDYAGYEKDDNSDWPSSSSAVMSQRVRQYTERACKRHAGLDEETARLVRNYQHQLLQNQSDRRHMLAQVRADIEARRRQLYTSKQSFLRDGVPGISLVGPGEGMAQKTGTQEDKDLVSSSGSQRHATTPDLLEGRSGLLLSSWTNRQQERSVSNSISNKWEPIRPFIADPERGFDHQETGLVQLYQPPGLGTMSDQLRENRSRENSLITGQGKRDRVRKSLSFEEKETSPEEERAADVSHVSWKDVLNETPSSERVWGTSEEEESSSPVLARSHTSLDNSGRAMESSDKSSVLTGSSSLNGSALVARAEERRVGFERRQAELRQQLVDIQQQKDSILQRYQAGQEALHHQQAALREKLLVAAAGGSLGQGQTTEASNVGETGKPATSTMALDKAQTWAESLALQQRSRVRSSTQTSRTSDSPTATEVRHSGRPSLSSAGTPGNISADSFLADISYHKLKNGDYGSLPTSAFQIQPAPSSTMPKREVPAGQRQTWATLLQSSSSVLQLSTRDPEPWMTGSTSATSDVVLSPKSGTPSLSVECPHGEPATNKLVEHQPHELSTIMEVETPTSSSTLRQQKQQGRLRDQIAGSESNSSQSLSSQSSSTVQGRTRGGTEIEVRQAPVIDRFPELPFTFTRPGTVYDLTSEGQMSGSTEKPTDKAGSAKRSINFSEESSNMSHRYRGQPLDFEDVGETEDLMSLPMPFLVQNTPAKPQDNLSSDLSSLQISGYSEYLRRDSLGDPTKELAQPKGLDSNPGLDSAEAPVTTGKFGPEVLQRLAQQSCDVFGDAPVTLPGHGVGESIMSGDITLGDKSSLPSMDLGEMSIQDTSEN